jgi:signal transduction histidine kinase
LSEELIEWVDDLLGPDHEIAYEAIGIASWRYEQAMRNVRKADTAQSLADAHAGAVFYRALLKSDPSEDFMTKVSQSAGYLFGFTGACHFRVIAEAGFLTTEIDGEPVRISFDDPRSAVASAFREQSLASNTIEQATLIEYQLLTRLGGQAFYCVPLRGSAGLLFLTADIRKINHIKGAGNVLVPAFADAVSDLYEREREMGAGTGTISLDHFKARTREITHEVNNPLAIVQNYLRTMAIKLESQSGAGDGVTREIDAISTELVRVSGLLQKFALIGEEDTLAYSDTDINGLIAELTSLVTADRQIDVEMHLDKTIPLLELAGDALRQVLLNILKNAAEALIDVPAPRIEVGTEGAVNLGGRHYLEIVITDNGPGMSAADRLELFNTGGDRTVSTKGEGRGLGLGIAKGLLDEMGGLIGIRDAHAASEETGTSFHILVPFETQ